MNILYQLLSVFSNANNQELDEKETRVLRDLLKFTSSPINTHTMYNPNQRSIDELMEDLDGLAGLQSVKNEIHQFISYLKVIKQRKEKGFPSLSMSYSYLFIGNQGTSKSVVADILAGIFSEFGLLTKGHLVEVRCSKLLAIEESEIENEIIEAVESALGGILFIDEAHELSSLRNENCSDIAIKTLIKCLEGNKGKIGVVLAGSTDKMQLFLDSHPDLKVYFNRRFEFSDFTPEELVGIFEQIAQKNGYTMDMYAKSKLQSSLEMAYVGRESSFCNAKFASQMFDKAVENQSIRLANELVLTEELLAELREEDIP